MLCFFGKRIRSVEIGNDLLISTEEWKSYFRGKFLTLMRKLFTLAFLLCIALPSMAGVIINEFSNGPSGSQEYFELAVVGNPGELVDIRGWIVDDHSGNFNCGVGNGIASGHLRFAIHSNWACVPAGSLILIYNPGSNKNVNITLADDPTDANNDRVYVLPVNSSPYIEANTSVPSSSSCQQYTGAYGASINWQPVGLGNGKDAATTVDPSNTSSLFHTVGYGFSGSSSNILFAGSGSGQNYSFTHQTSDNWSLQANWTKSSSSTGDTPGAPNNTANAMWLNSLSTWTASADVTSGCAPLTVQFSNSIGTASSWTHNWDYDDGSTPGTTAEPSHTFTANGNYDVVYVGTSPGGCTLTDTFTIQVQSGGTVTPPTLSAVCIGQGLVSLPTGTPAGTWSGTGVTGGMFDPAVAGLGTTTLTYTVTGPCGGTGTSPIQVIASPQATITASATSVCENGSNVTLQGTPAGGTYSGAGVTGSSFNPSTAGSGSHWVYYTNTTSCGTAVDSVSIAVTALPTSSITIGSTNFCTSDAAAILQGTPGGGTFSGSGVTGNSFNPSTAGIGSHWLYYTTTNACGSSVDSVSVSVIAQPQAAITSPVSSACDNGTSVTLQGTPSGGVFSGTGVTGSSFDPSAASIGTNWIYYTNSTSCGTAVDSVAITVIAQPQATITATTTNTCDNITTITLQGIPTGGIYSGTGVTGSNFNPSVAGAGSHWVYYTNSNSCGTVIDSVSITVTAVPQASLTISATSACENTAVLPMQGTPAGGTYSGTGVVGSNFDPSTVSAGMYWAYYTNQNTCGTAVDSVQVTVLPQPQASISAATTNTCDNVSAVTLSGTPTGGVFSGTNVTGNNFNPSAAGAGSYWTYYSNTNSCGTATDSVSITVIQVPQASLTISATSVCENTAVLTMQGTPVGGIYSGTGVAGSNFDPSTVSAGMYWAYYTNQNSCGTAIDSVQVTVLPQPQSAVSAPVSSVCDTTSAVPLLGTPTGGVFSGTGVSGSDFIPATAGVGSHWLYYATTNSCGTAVDSVSISILTFPLSSIVSPGITVCEDAGLVQLQATPSGGTFSGTSVTGSQFNPATAGGGPHWLYYTNQNICGTAIDSTSLVVIELAQASINTPVSQVCFDSPAFALQGQPSGGAFYGTSVSGVTFNPASASSGINWAYYTNQNSCGAAVDSVAITVIPEPKASILSPSTQVCENAGIIALSGQPLGGVFSGQGVFSSNFDPGFAGEGGHWAYYATQNTCGTAIDSIEINVLALPTASISASVSEACENGVPVTLLGLPAGGSFSGNGITNNLFYPDQVGPSTQKLFYTNQNGCGRAVDSLQITIKERPQLQVPQLNYLICNDDEAELMVDQWVGTLSWSTGADEPSIFVSEAGLYRVSATNTCGIEEVTIQVDTASATATFTAQIQEFKVGMFDANRKGQFSYTWLIDGTEVGVDDAITHEFPDFGGFDVTLEVTSKEGCTAVEDQYFTVEPGNQLYIPRAFTPNGDGLNDEFKIVGDPSNQFAARVFDRWGNMVAEWFDIDSGWNGFYNGSVCSDGIYTLQLEHQGEKYLHKITLLGKPH